MSLHKHRGAIGIPKTKPSGLGRGRGLVRKPVVVGKKVTLKKKIG